MALPFKYFCSWLS